jgi:hypothetical protein
MAERIPIIVLSGPSTQLKVQLASDLVTQAKPTVEYTVLSDLAPDAFGSELTNRLQLSGCMCCVGAVTLMSQLMALLRSLRREKPHSGILLIGSAALDCSTLIDQLRQPLLIELIEITKVIFAAQTLNEAHLTAITTADTLFTPSAAVHFDWLRELAGSDDRTIVSGTHALMFEGKQPISSDFKHIWSAQTVFDRQRVLTILQRYSAYQNVIDGVFRTERAWYRWRGTQATLEETSYRRNSFLQINPPNQEKDLLQEILSQIGT